MRRLHREKIIYNIVKDIESGNRNITHNTYKIDEDMFHKIATNIKEMNLIRNIIITSVTKVSFANSSITADGVKYLKKNSIEML
jgi:hypothetical protein